MHKPIILFDDHRIRQNLLPFTFTRPIADLRIGILKISEKWEKHLNCSFGWLTEPHLQDLFVHANDGDLLVNGAVMPDLSLVSWIKNLEKKQSLWSKGMLIATYRQEDSLRWNEIRAGEHKVEYPYEISAISHLWHIFQHNGGQIRADYDLITRGRTSFGPQDQHTYIYNETNVFIEPGAHIRACVINAENGPVYIGKSARIGEGSVIIGPFALCDGAELSLGARMRGDITIGPYCKVGGEVKNTVFLGYSNKSHEGYLGNSVVGEWCNLGANTNGSNMKNNHGQIKVWSYPKENFTNTGLAFCGSFIGDHSKLGISTMLNSGTVVGVGANVFGGGFQAKMVPSFAWGSEGAYETFELRKFEDTAKRVMSLKGREFSSQEKAVLQRVFEMTRPFRAWDKDF